MRKIVTIIAVIAFIAFVAFKLKANKEVIETTTEEALNIEKYEFVPVNIFEVQSEENVLSVEELGSFASRQELTVNSNTSGQLTSLNVKEGQYVSKGTLIAKVDHTALSSQLSTLKISLTNAKKDLERIQNANSVGATTKMQIEQAQLQVDNIQSNITNVLEQIKFYTITAPMSGYVDKVLLEKGSYAMPGTPIVEMIDINTIKLVVNVDERVVPLLKIGKNVSVTTEVFPNKVFTGKISKINVKADASKKFEIDVDIPNTGNLLKAGMYGKVKFDQLSSSASYFLPRSAIVGSINAAEVFLVNADSTVKSAKVKVGTYQGNNIEILEGLQSGDQVVTMGQINLRDGAKVTVVK